MNLESNTVKLLSEYGEGYALLYEIGTGLGAELSQLLSLQVDDVKGKVIMLFYQAS